MIHLPEIQTARHEKRVSELDGLRGIAILQVLIWHYFAGPMSAQLIWPVFNKSLGLTWSGVDLFFVLSGFLLGGILIDNKGSSNFFRVFYSRRCCRILPLYFLWILLFAVIVCLIKDRSFEFPFVSLFDLNIYHTVGLGHYLTFTQNFPMALNHDWGNEWFGITWSLAVEEQFYLVLPLIIFFTPRRFLIHVFLFFIVLAPVLRTMLSFYLGPYNGAYWGFFSMPCRGDAFILGALSALALRKEGFKDFAQRYILFFYAVAAGLLGYLFFMDFRGEGVCTGEMTKYGYSLLALFYSCVLIIAVVEKRGFVTAIARHPWLGKLGVISYGVYIFHQAVIYLVHACLFHNEPMITEWSNGLATVLAFILTLLLAWISWTFFEKPIVHLGHSLNYKKRQT